LRGPRGVGFLYVGSRVGARDHPLFVDMRGARWIDASTYELADSAIRFEDWEFAYALVLGLAAATKYARAIGVPVAQRRAWALARISVAAVVD
jgi:selenocysteine lyase/cysteine desulfurase